MRGSHWEARRWAFGLFLGFSWCLVTVCRADPPEPSSPVPEIRADNLYRHLAYLTSADCGGREAGSPGGRRAGDYLRAQLQQLPLRGAGDRGALEQPFLDGMRNILALLPGSDEALAREVLVVCAHYDHVGYGTKENSRGPIGRIHPGADDNASGVSGLLELAAALVRLPRPPKRSVLFAFFDGEEKEMLGSRHWTSHPTLSPGAVVAALNLDMIGRLRENRVIVYGSRTAYGLRRLVSFQNADRLGLDFSWELEDDADHYALFQHGVPVLFLYTGDHDDAHSPRDSLDRINLAGMETVVRLAFRIAWELAERPDPPRLRPDASQETEKSRRQWEADWPGAQARIRRVADSGQPPRVGISWRFDESEPHSAVVTRVFPHSAAAAAGLRLGDRVYRVSGQEFADTPQLQQLLGAGPLELLVEREGRLSTVSLREGVADQRETARSAEDDSRLRKPAEQKASTVRRNRR